MSFQLWAEIEEMIGADDAGFSRIGLWDFLYAVDYGDECVYAG